MVSTAIKKKTTFWGMVAVTNAALLFMYTQLYDLANIYLLIYPALSAAALNTWIKTIPEAGLTKRAVTNWLVISYILVGAYLWYVWYGYRQLQLGFI